MKTDNLEHNLISNFIAYLQDLGVSELTIRNYKSDLNHFSGWLILKTRSMGVSADHLAGCLPFLNKKIGFDYRNFLLQNATPHITINRRLSSLRHLSKFLVLSQIIDFDFMNDLPNLDSSRRKISSFPLLDEFEHHLAKEKASASTIKNYLSDIRHFLTWLQIKQQSLN